MPTNSRYVPVTDYSATLKALTLGLYYARLYQPVSEAPDREFRKLERDRAEIERVMKGYADRVKRVSRCAHKHASVYEILECDDCAEVMCNAD